MRIALLADIHANLHALKAVLKDIAPSGMDSLVSLGDVVGYGANPAECVDLLRKLGCQGVMGNHDFYVSSESPGVESSLAEPESATSPDGKRNFLAIRRSEARREHRPIFCDQARKSERADRGCWDYSSLAKTPVAARTEIF